MCIFKFKKRKVNKCKLVKTTSYYINGRLVERELTYECKPKYKVYKVRKARKQQTAREALLDLIYKG